MYTNVLIPPLNIQKKILFIDKSKQKKFLLEFLPDPYRVYSIHQIQYHHSIVISQQELMVQHHQLTNEIDLGWDILH
jgi:hypothetical protein